MRRQALRLRAGEAARGTRLELDGHYDRLHCDQVVQGARAATRLPLLLQGDRYMESRLHDRRNYQRQAPVSGRIHHQPAIEDIVLDWPSIPE